MIQVSALKVLTDRATPVTWRFTYFGLIRSLNNQTIILFLIGMHEYCCFRTNYRASSRLLLPAACQRGRLQRRVAGTSSIIEIPRIDYHIKESYCGYLFLQRLLVAALSGC